MNTKVEGQSVSPNDAKSFVLRLREIIEQELNKEIENARNERSDFVASKYINNIETLRLLRRLIDLLPPVA